MTWTRALVYVAMWLILTVGYFATRGVRSDDAEAPAPVAVSASPAEPDAEAAYLQIKPEDVVEVEVSAGDRRVRATRDGQRWLIAEPPGAAVSSDLISALLSALLGASGVQVFNADASRDGEFGLDAPQARVRLATADGGGVDLVLGKQNPAQTGVYGRAAGSSEIVLVGLNARYYVDLLLRTAG